MNKEIVFEAKINFKGSIREFEKLASDLGKLSAYKGVMIETVPLPEKPRDKARGLMIGTVPMPDLEVGGLMIGTWPTPEEKARGLMIETIPVPEIPFPGIWPTTKLLSEKLLDKITEDLPRVRINRDIYGGIRNPHLHVKNEVVLLSKARFREFVGQVAGQLSKELLK